MDARPWTREQVEELRRRYPSETPEGISEMAVRMGFTPEQVEAKARELCIGKNKRAVPGLKMPRWKPDDIETLRALYPVTPNLEIARRMQRSVKSVVSKAGLLGLKKSPERLREMGASNVAKRRDRTEKRNEDGRDEEVQ